MDAKERLQKFIARCGVASRRKAEELIRSGRVKVNNRVVTEMGLKIDPRYDKIKVDGKRILPEKPVVVMLHKPREYVSTVSDPEERQTVLDLLPETAERLYPVGRLDYHSEGLILLTNDGTLTQKVLHPKHNIPRIYDVKVKGHVTETTLEAIRAGVQLDDGKTRPCLVEYKEHLPKNTWLTIEVYEGRNRLVRRLFEHFGYEVLRLIRVQFGPLKLKGLAPGKYRYLNQIQIEKLRKVAGVTTP